MPGGVPKEAVATMEAAMKRIYDSQAYKEFGAQHVREQVAGQRDLHKYLAERRVVQEEFLKALGVVK
jgi:tripartite-type tricarboxylate transporter receptor subunit TctC